MSVAAPSPTASIASPTTRTSPLTTISSLIKNHGSTIIIDTRSVNEFLDGHIPGAIPFPLGSLIMEDTSRHRLEALAAAAARELAKRGISPQHDIVLVDGDDGSACFGLIVCELAGHTSVQVLPGGVNLWINAGHETNHSPSEQLAQSEAEWRNTEIGLDTVAGIEDVLVAGTRGVRVVDVRSQLEFEGIVGSPCCKSRGHIPGAIHLDWTTLLAATGEIHSPEKVLQEAQGVGLSVDDDIIVYCHSGQRSAVAATALRNAGFTKVRNYLGSWHEWAHRELPSGPETTQPV